MSPSPSVFDPFRYVHKGLRRELAELVAFAGQVDTRDPRQTARLAGRWAFAKDFLEAHQLHEEEHVMPVLERAAPEVATALARQHEQLDDDVTSLGALDGHAFYLALCAFVGRYLLHLETEERVVVDVLRRALGDAALEEMEQRILAGIRPDRLATFFSCIFRATNLDEQEAFLRRVKARATPALFATMWTLASASLAPEAFRALEVRFAAPRPDLRALLAALPASAA